MAGSTGRSSASVSALRSTQEEAKWWSKDTVVVITGANRGIGLELARQLSNEGVTVVGTARTESAAAALKGEQLEGVRTYSPLEVARAEDANQLAAWLKEEYGGVDVLINNAGMFINQNVPPTAEEAAKTVEVNYKGPITVTEALLPLLRASPNGPRIIHVWSRLGQLSNVGSNLRARFLDPSLSRASLDALMAEYVVDVKAGTSQKGGWTSPAYHVSKVGLGAYSRLLSKELEKEGRDIAVNCMCPGWCQTDMGGPSATRTAAQGADTGVWLTLHAPPRVTGKAFADREEVSW